MSQRPRALSSIDGRIECILKYDTTAIGYVDPMIDRQTRTIRWSKARAVYTLLR